MKDAILHLDQRFEALRPFVRKAHRPPKGWLRAIRDALGMTTTQFAKRLQISQPSAFEIEKAEVAGAVTLKTLQRAAGALNCRLVYVLIPDKSLEDAVEQRAEFVASKRLRNVEQTMSLEDQTVQNPKATKALHKQIKTQLLQKPARLWDES